MYNYNSIHILPLFYYLDYMRYSYLSFCHVQDLEKGCYNLCMCVFVCPCVQEKNSYNYKSNTLEREKELDEACIFRCQIR